MGTSFPRTTHSLQATNFRRAIFNLSLITLLLGIWFAWFFFSKVTLFEISEPVEITNDHILVVNYPLKSPDHFKRGQTALLKLAGALGSEIGPIPALVTNVESDLVVGQIQVESLVFWELAPPVPSGGTVIGQLEIEVEHVSPAILVVSTINDGLETFSARFTPQDQSQVSKNTQQNSQ